MIISQEDYFKGDKEDICELVNILWKNPKFAILFEHTLYIVGKAKVATCLMAEKKLFLEIVFTINIILI